MTFSRIIKFFKTYFLKHPWYVVAYGIAYFLPKFSFDVSFYDGEAIKKKIQQGKSIIRFGDGEIYMMNGGSIGYQKYEPYISKILFEIIRKYNDDSPYILGVNELVMSKTNRYLRSQGKLHVWLPMKIYYFFFFPKKMEYMDASFFYYNEHFSKFIEPVLRGRHLIFVSAKKNIENIKKNNKFPPGLISDFVETSGCDAYDVYDQIAEEVLNIIKKIPKDKKPIVLAAFGPASKVFAYEFSQKGIQVLDIGVGIEILYNDKRIDGILFPRESIGA